MKENNLCDIRAIDVVDYLLNGSLSGRSGAEIYNEYCERQWEKEEKRLNEFKSNIRGVYKLLDSAVTVPSIKHKNELTCGYALSGRQDATGENIIKAVFSERFNRAFEEFVDCVEDYYKMDMYDTAVKGWERKLSISECFYLKAMALIISESIRKSYERKE